MKTTQPEPRAAFTYLRSVCRDLKERAVLGRAIRNHWNAAMLTDVAESFRGTHGIMIRPKEAAYRRAIHIGAERVYDGSYPHRQYWALPEAPPLDPNARPAS